MGYYEVCDRSLRECRKPRLGSREVSAIIATLRACIASAQWSGEKPEDTSEELTLRGAILWATKIKMKKRKLLLRAARYSRHFFPESPVVFLIIASFNLHFFSQEELQSGDDFFFNGNVDRLSLISAFELSQRYTFAIQSRRELKFHPSKNPSRIDRRLIFTPVRPLESSQLRVLRGL